MRLFSFIKNNFLFCLGMAMLLLLLFVTFLGEYLPIIDSDLKETDYIWTEERIPLAPPYEPSSEFLLGSDRLGRDLLSLIVMGAKETLFIVAAVALIRYLLAIPLAYFAHKKRFGLHLILNWINGFLSYIPTIILLLLLVTLPPILVTELRPLYIILIIAVLEVGRVAEMIRLEFNQISTKEFVLSGTSVGVSSMRLLGRYYMPYLYGKLLINMVGDVGKVMFLLGQIGFLGIYISQDFVQVDPGIFEFQNTSLSWPMLLLNAYKDIRGAIWIPFYPALAMTYVIFTFNVLSQGLQKLVK